MRKEKREMTWTNEALTPYALAHEARAEGTDYRLGSAPIAGWQAGFLELAAELVALRKRLEPRPDDPDLETIWQPKLRCPTCNDRLEPMESAPPETTGVCPGCGEFVRSFALAVEAPERGAPCPACTAPMRTYLAVRVYADAEADERAHPEVLAKLRAIQSTIRAAAICGCDNRGAKTGECVCAGGCGCHGADNDVDVPASQVTRSDAAIACACEFKEDALACSVNRDQSTPETADPCGCHCHGEAAA